MFPAARLTDKTVTQDFITAPGAPLVLICGMPASCVGDSVMGPECVGAITTGAFTILICGRPAARVTSSVAGAHTKTGLPIVTIVGPPCGMTVLLGG